MKKIRKIFAFIDIYSSKISLLLSKIYAQKEINKAIGLYLDGDISILERAERIETQYYMIEKIIEKNEELDRQLSSLKLK